MKPIQEFLKENPVFLFAGDSITDCGRNRGDPLDLGPGYPQKVAAVYRALYGNEVQFYNRGVRGDTVRDLLARYDEDLLALRPGFVSILAGGNDAWHCFDEVNRYTPPQEFEEVYRTLLEKIRRDLPQTRIMIIEPYEMFWDDLAEKFRNDLDPKIARIRSLAEKYADYYLPLDGVLHAQARKTSPRQLMQDGIHPTDCGHRVIARAYLETLGLL